jgi:trimeric autotransporter adhesin
LRHKIEANPLSAVDKKVLSTTTERKVMSKKTFFKRIALTAIAALGFGMLSVAPSKALILSTSVSFDADDTKTLAGTSADSATAVLTFTQNALSATDSQTVKVSITSSNGAGVTNLYMRVTETSTSSTPIGTSDQSATSPFIYFGAASSGTSTAPATLRSRAGYEFAGAAFTTANYDSLTVAPRSAAINSSTVKMTVGLYKITSPGTYTVKAIVIDNPNNGTGGTLNAASATWTVTVSAAAVTAATANSTATLRQGLASITAPFGGTAEATDSQTLGTATATTTDLTPEFSLLIRQKDASAVNAARESYTVQVVGEAFVTAGTTIAGTAVASYSAGTRPLTSLSGSNSVVGTKYLRMATSAANAVKALQALLPLLAEQPRPLIARP